MSFDAGPFDLQSTPLVLGPQGKATPKEMTPDFYAELAREFDRFAGHVLVSRHEFEEPWPTWEMHPKGDEMVCLLFGDVDFVLRGEDGEQVVRVDRPGDYVVVPRGVWHTVRPRTRSSMLFVTPGEGTENAESPV
ncbi:MAG: cupin domain-containing protein [Alphaproteobacteria bacterium]|nr:cupin domain-containing protein [Alphaproteobacteria bacterium]